MRPWVVPESCVPLVQAFRGFAGTSVLILVGVATDSARRVRAEQAMQRYKDYDKLYDEM
jgi:preprotein translocase subunit SecY